MRAVSIDTEGWAFHRLAQDIKKNVDRNIDIVGRSYSGYTSVLQLGHVNTLYPDITNVLFTSFGRYDVKCKNRIAYNPLVKDDMVKQGIPTYYIRQSIDDDRFNVVRNKSKRLRVAFVGNPKRNVKRYHLYEAVKEKLSDVIDFKEALQLESRTGQISLDDMGEFYKTTDLILCTSSEDCGPAAPFEAGLCKVPTLICSNKVGFTSIATEGLEYFKVDNQDVKSISDYILYLDENRELIDIVGDNVYRLMKLNHTFKANSEAWKMVLEM